MKTFSTIQFLALAVILCCRANAEAQPARAPATNSVPARSVFIMPTSPNEGRDPFYPESTRVYQVAVAATAPRVAEFTDLKVKGYSNIGGNPMVIINNHAFMISDEGDVLTPGGRVHIRCLDIKPSNAIIEVNGQVHDLRF